MSTTLKKTTAPKSQGKQPAEEQAEIERIRAKVRTRRLHHARELASRMKTLPDGTRIFIRFNARERFEHQILIGSFTALAFTGLLQSFSKYEIVAWFINVLLGGIETLRTIHHLAAILFAVQAVYHFSGILYAWFVKREWGSMWPRLSDFQGLVGMFKFNLNLAKERPAFDRFSIEEKVEYWALLWGTIIMGITGIFQWFPALVTSVLPGVIIPVARAIHAWEALLAALSILTWHMYHTIIKENNQSIFTGYMTEEEMQEAHALEYQRILAAVEYVKKTGGKSQTVKTIEVPHELVEFETTD